MIRVLDNYYPKEVFEYLQHYCDTKPFQMVKAGDKEFCSLPAPEKFEKYTDITGYHTVLSFIRKAYKGFDNEWRIHADNIINGHKIDVATVLYINENEGVTENGTSFWRHKIHGFELNKNIDNKEFDRILTEDSNDLSKWNQTDFISARPNRLLAYDANLFHSKYPQEIEEGERIVMVNFYSKNK